MPEVKREIDARGQPQSDQQRLEAVRVLVESLDADDSFWLNQEWAETLDRRAAEMDADSSKSVPWQMSSDGLLHGFNSMWTVEFHTEPES